MLPYVLGALALALLGNVVLVWYIRRSGGSQAADARLQATLDQAKEQADVRAAQDVVESKTKPPGSFLNDVTKPRGLFLPQPRQTGGALPDNRPGASPRHVVLGFARPRRETRHR